MSGSFSFILDEAKSFNYVQIGLFGSSYVHWSESHSTGTGDNSRTETRYYSSTETYIEQTSVVWSKEQSPTGTIGPGSYEYQFQFNLPDTCPTSFESTYGRIRYLVQGKIGTGFLKFDHRVEAPIQVTHVVDINQQLSLFEPVRQSKKKQVGCWCCVSGDIELTAETTRTGYCINGDTVPLSVTIENGSGRTITIRASIVKTGRYYAQGHQQSTSSPVAIVNSTPIQPRTTTGVELAALQVPATEPTISIPSNLKLNYELHVTAVIPWALNLTVAIPLVLGNVPYRQAGLSGPPPLQPGLSSVQPSAAYPPPFTAGAATDTRVLGFVVPNEKRPAGDYITAF